MNLNVDKCSVMHIGCNNIQGNNNMSMLSTVADNRSTAGSRNHHQTWRDKKKERKAAKRTTEYGGLLPAISGTKTKNWSSNYTNLSQPTSRTCSVIILVPPFRQDIDKIEKIQRRSIKIIPEIRNHSYHQRIQVWHHATCHLTAPHCILATSAPIPSIII